MTRVLFVALGVLSRAVALAPVLRRQLRRASAQRGELVTRWSTVSDEVSELKKLRASQLQAELKALGVRYDDCFDKDDLLKRLLETKSSRGPGQPDAAPKTEARKSRGTAPPPSADDAPPPRAEAPPQPEPTAQQPASSLEDVRKEASKMRLGALQAELKLMGVSTVGMLEKGELVEAFAQAKCGGKVPGAAGKGAGKAGASAAPPRDDWIFDDGDIKELKTTKMPKAGEDKAKGGGAGGGMPGMGGMGGMGGMPGMGGMGGMPGMGGSPGAGGAPGGMPGMGGGGGIDLGSILSGLMGGMGGMGGAAGGPGGGGAAPDMSQLLQRAMGNPKVMATIQNAMKDPKAMAAIQDVMAKGPSAIGKYANDPELKKILDDLRSIL